MGAAADEEALIVTVVELEAVGEGDTVAVGEEDTEAVPESVEEKVAVPVSVEEKVAVREEVGDNVEVADDVTDGDSEFEGDALDEAVNTDGHPFALCAVMRY